MGITELPAAVRAKKAVVYVRQSTLAQVQGNLESQRRQYELTDVARQYGFTTVEVIDADLGRSASGNVARPGFEQLVAQVCGGTVGAVLCLEASRMARNGRDWHHLLELCGLVGAYVIDGEGVYDPRQANDRLLLGLKGTMSEFELNLLRTRLGEARTAKARRGELRLTVPVGYCWSKETGLDLDPDRRVQDVVRLIFQKFTELGSGRRVHLWMRRAGLTFPTPHDGKRRATVTWRPPMYRHINGILTNPFYAGVYAYGKSERRTTIVDGRAHTTYGHGRPQAQWSVFLQEHHPAYITWAAYATHQARLARNAYGMPGDGAKSGRGGRALLAGLLRCRRCGRRLHVHYSGQRGIRYSCKGGHVNHGVAPCINFGALRPDAAIAHAVLAVVQPLALEAADQAAAQVTTDAAQRHRTLELEREHARYDAQLAERRYAACDPDQRLVAAELEARWNAALQRLHACDERLAVPNAPPVAEADRARLCTLAADLPTLWQAPTTAMREKQRIVRVLIEEIVVDVDEPCREVLLVIHWRGGQHSELRVRKPQSGEHTKRTGDHAVDLIRQMAGQWSDDHIAATLNRLGLNTGQLQSWTAKRVGTLRRTRGIAAYASAHKDGAWLTMRDAARALGVTAHVVRRLVTTGTLPAQQVMPDAPWQIRATDLEAPAIQHAVTIATSRGRRPCRTPRDERTPMFPGL